MVTRRPFSELLTYQRHNVHFREFATPACQVETLLNLFDGTSDANEDEENEEEEEEEEEGDEHYEDSVSVKAKPAMAKQMLAKKPAAAKPVKAKPAMAKSCEEDPKLDTGPVRLESPYPNGECYIRYKIDGKLKCLVDLKNNHGATMARSWRKCWTTSRSILVLTSLVLLQRR